MFPVNWTRKPLEIRKTLAIVMFDDLVGLSVEDIISRFLEVKSDIYDDDDYEWNIHTEGYYNDWSDGGPDGIEFIGTREETVEEQTARYALDGSKLAQMGFQYPVEFMDSLVRTVEWSVKDENKHWLGL